MSEPVFQLRAAAPTDFWRKPPDLDVQSAPKQLQTLSSKEFHRARVTVSAPWTRLYDQGGLFVSFASTVGRTFGESTPTKRCWLKTGIEFYEGRANLSTVAAREWADWSLLPLDGNSVTIEIKREAVDAAKGSGSSLWVYLIEGDKRTAVREVTWAFENEGEISVGVYAARPTIAEDDKGEELVVEFEGLVIE